jgi:hypothetical protein
MNLECTLNGRNATPGAVRELLSIVADRDRLTANGGFLFRAHMTGSRAFFGVLPVILEGVRYYHYDIRLGTSAVPVLVGEFDPDESVRILCPPTGGHDRSPYDIPAVRFQVSLFCRFITSHGYPGERALDWITMNWFSETGLFDPEVCTVGDAALAG